MLNTAIDVWKFLIKHGGADLRLYDEDLIDEIRAKLALPPGDVGSALKKKAVTTEDFLIAFFRAAQPYAAMMVDLLAMFAKAGAKETKQNLEVQFDFGKDIPALKFDLEHFRAWAETWRKVERVFVVNVWNHNTLWALNEVVRTMDAQVRDPGMKRWLSEYDQGFWPNFLPPLPHTGTPDLDDRLQRTWSVWSSVVQESTKFGRNRNKLHRRAFEESRKSSTSDEPEEQHDFWPANLLGRIDHDLWAGSLARGIYSKVEQISSLPSIEQERESSALVVALDKVFAMLSTRQYKGTSLERQLEEFLKLPVWQRRHELYSAWVSTQILDALSEWSVKVHTINDALVFAFSGTHLATVRSLDPALHVWAELRSPLKGPIGSGRKRAIQPDYTLITDPITDVAASILIVECKQYRAASAKKFAHALTDYAKGRPSAHVVLVNYGKVRQNILDLVDQTFRGRTSIIGEMKPGSCAALQTFGETVQRALRDRYGPIDKSLKTVGPEATTDTGGRISLSWGANPSDLDLHLFIASEGETIEICYSERGDIEASPWALLDNDLRTGNCTENIQIARWLKGKYHCVVTNYSKDAPLAGCGAEVMFRVDGNELRLNCPKEGDGSHWYAFVFDSDARRIEVINAIADNPLEHITGED